MSQAKKSKSTHPAELPAERGGHLGWKAANTLTPGEKKKMYQKSSWFFSFFRLQVKRRVIQLWSFCLFLFVVLKFEKWCVEAIGGPLAHVGDVPNVRGGVAKNCSRKTYLGLFYCSTVRVNESFALTFSPTHIIGNLLLKVPSRTCVSTFILHQTRAEWSSFDIIVTVKIFFLVFPLDEFILVHTISTWNQKWGEFH